MTDQELVNHLYKDLNEHAVIVTVFRKNLPGTDESRLFAVVTYQSGDGGVVVFEHDTESGWIDSKAGAQLAVRFLLDLVLEIDRERSVHTTK